MLRPKTLFSDPPGWGSLIGDGRVPRRVLVPRPKFNDKLNSFGLGTVLADEEFVKFGTVVKALDVVNVAAEWDIKKITDFAKTSLEDTPLARITVGAVPTVQAIL